MTGTNERTRTGTLRQRAVPLLLALVASSALVGPTAGFAGGAKATARSAIQLFANHCFSPYLTSEKARQAFALSGMAFDFYDLDPFSSVAPSPAQGAPVTAGTDRRCEVSFAGNHAESAAEGAMNALAHEMIFTPAPVPPSFRSGPDTTLLAARRLNPRRVAVVHIGTREGALGLETFMSVHRLLPTTGGD